MTGFIKLHTGADEVVFINPVHIVKIEETDFPLTCTGSQEHRTLISTVDDTCIGVVEKPYAVCIRTEWGIIRAGRGRVGMLVTLPRKAPHKLGEVTMQKLRKHGIPLSMTRRFLRLRGRK